LYCESVVYKWMWGFRCFSEGKNNEQEPGILGSEFRVEGKRLGESFDFWVRVCILRGGVHRVLDKRYNVLDLGYIIVHNRGTQYALCF